MTKSKDEALRMALEALEQSHPEAYRHVITAIKEALQSNEQVEPVAWRGYNWGHSPDDWVYRDFDDPILDGNGNNVGQPLFTHPPVPTAQPEAETQEQPVAWLIADGEDLWATNEKNMMLDYPKSQVTPLYTTPPQRTWVGLTMNEMDDLNATSDVGTYNHIKAIEAKLKEKNT